MNEIKTTEDIDKLFKARKLTKYVEKIKVLARPKIKLIKLFTEANIQIGKSKIGGKPDLQNETEWPKTGKKKSMSFIAQINCEEIIKYDTQQLLPKKGLISFFYCADQEPWGFDPKDKTDFKVIYTPNIKKLENRAFPNDLELNARFNCDLVAFNTLLSLPDWGDNVIDNIFENEFDEETYSSLSGDYTCENQIFGYANVIQNAMELQCQLVTNGLYCGNETGYEDPIVETLKEGASDWILLLQIDSTDEAGTNMMWGDRGTIYFWIKKQDLKEKNFNNVWCILQCY